MRKFIFAAAGAFALSASGTATAITLSDEEVAECVQQCIQSDSEAGLTKYCAPYSNKRPFHLYDICTEAFKLGGAGGCERACASQGSCMGLRFDSKVVARRDEGCQPFHQQMPRPAAYEVCKEGYLKGFEAKCQFVEAEFAKAREEEEAELRKHLNELDMAVEQNAGSGSSSLAFEQQQEQERLQAEAEAAEAARLAAEAEAAAAKAREHEALRGAAAAAAAKEAAAAAAEVVAPAAPEPVVVAVEDAPAPAEVVFQEPAAVEAAAPVVVEAVEGAASA